MNSYEYGSALFNSRRAAITAMCEDWLTAQGLNDWDSAEVQEALADPAKAAAEMTAADWNTLAIVGRRDDDGDPVYETIPTADLQGALEGIAEWRAGLYRVTIGETEVGETSDKAAVAGLLAEAREMMTWASHYGEAIRFTAGGISIDLTDPANAHWLDAE